MAATRTDEPSVSVTLPLARDADPGLLRICLGSLVTQTSRDFEILVLLSRGSPKNLEAVLDEFPSAVVFEESLSKSGARNFLAEKARGKYIMYIDVDMELDPNVLAECHETAANLDSFAIIIPFKVAETGHLIRKCRRLERELLKGDLGSEIPILVRTSLFRQVGGFDESLGLLDDWSLTSKLHSNEIRPDRIVSPLYLRETVNLFTAIRGKYQRGRWLPALLTKYHDVQQAQIGKRFLRTYVRNWRKLLKSPFIAVCLVFLKALEVSALTLGKLNPVRPVPFDSSAVYLQKDVAASYDSVRLGDSFHRFKHVTEVESLIDLIGAKDGSFLEVGCGTGRITQVLADRGHTLLGVDPSAVMLAEYSIKTDMPGAAMADGTALPFPDSCFDGTYSVRVIWHLPNSSGFKQFLAEMARVSSDFIIVDIANAERWRHPLIRTLTFLVSVLRPGFRDGHRTSQLLTIDQFSILANELGLQIEHLIPLDVLSPFWLNLLPKPLAAALFPRLRNVEVSISRMLPPGRIMALLRRASSN